MKCVGYRPTGGVFRTSDIEARKLVEQGAGMWVYDCKKGWKSQGRMTTIQQVVEFKESPVPKKLDKAKLEPTVVENAGEMVGGEIAIVRQRQSAAGQRRRIRFSVIRCRRVGRGSG